MEVEAKYPNQNIKRFCDIKVGEVFSDTQTSMVYVKTSHGYATHMSSGATQEIPGVKGCLMAKKVTVEF